MRQEGQKYALRTGCDKTAIGRTDAPSGQESADVAPPFVPEAERARAGVPVRWGTRVCAPARRSG
ncbi:hypothetical protein GCM10010294_17860 [Streptomyces griseoloalbus]|nr:hypothetical protein GCM10010294_17860 [Streptomyces griseoloalbus]